MARMREAETQGPAWLVQAATIARAFYVEGQSKTEIADTLGLSRFKVARILDEARAMGLVEVRVRLPAQIDPELSRLVRQRFGLDRAIVSEHDNGSAASLREDLGRLAAGLLTELVKANDVLGLTCSRTVAATTNALRSLPSCDVVQLTGTLAGPDMDTGSVESVRRATAIGGGKAFPLYAPMVLPDSATARALYGESAIRRTVEQFDRVTVAMVSIGGWNAALSTVWETVTASDRAEVTHLDVAGEIGGRLFDRDGQKLSTAIDDRVMGATLAQLRRIPGVIGLAYDARRAVAVRAALSAGLVDTLVCDADLGRALLET